MDKKMNCECCGKEVLKTSSFVSFGNIRAYENGVLQNNYLVSSIICGKCYKDKMATIYGEPMRLEDIFGVF